jgi:hypothetical protein
MAPKAIFCITNAVAKLTSSVAPTTITVIFLTFFSKCKFRAIGFTEVFNEHIGHDAAFDSYF